MKDKIILGLESSCDETAVGIIKNGQSLGGGSAKHFCDIFPPSGNIIYINEQKAKDILEILSQSQNIES